LKKGLTYLLADDRWRRRGEAAYQFVRAVFATPKAIDRHIKIYRKVIARELD
jgi:hypothetical protein